MDRESVLSFPGLGIGEFTVSSTAFSIFDAPIAWYAIIITIGMICAVGYAFLRARKIGLVLDDVIDLALFAIPIGIIGARLYYVLSEIDQYDSFMEVLNIRNGGLAIYGGIIAGALAVLGVCLYKKINFFAFADCCTPGIILAQAIGRWGNFMNGEAFGSQTESFLRMGIKNSTSFHTFHTADMVYVHPTFLYESLWNILGFVLINIFYKHKKYDGQIMLMVFGWYGLGRMLIEGLRMDSLWTGPFGVITLIFLVILLAAVGFVMYCAPSIIKSIKEKNITKSEKIRYISIGSTIALSIIMIALDVTVIHSVTVIKEQRVSQVLAALIFIVCSALLIYFMIRKPDRPLYFKEKTEKKAKSK